MTRDQQYYDFRGGVMMTRLYRLIITIYIAI